MDIAELLCSKFFVLLSVHCKILQVLLWVDLFILERNIARAFRMINKLIQTIVLRVPNSTQEIATPKAIELTYHFLDSEHSDVSRLLALFLAFSSSRVISAT